MRKGQELTEIESIFHNFSSGLKVEDIFFTNFL